LVLCKLKNDTAYVLVRTGNVIIAVGIFFNGQHD